MGREARMCPSPVAEPLLGTSPVPEGNPVQPGASAWATTDSYFIFPLEQGLREQLPPNCKTCFICFPCLDSRLVLQGKLESCPQATFGRQVSSLRTF